MFVAAVNSDTLKYKTTFHSRAGYEVGPVAVTVGNYPGHCLNACFFQTIRKHSRPLTAPGCLDPRKPVPVKPPIPPSPPDQRNNPCMLRIGSSIKE